MCTLQPRVRTERRRCAPESFPCPSCGTPGRRKGLHTRTVRCLAYREILLVELTTAEYRAGCSCCKTFRSHVEGVLPRAEYTTKVREAVLDRLLGDKMSVEGLRASLARDFHLDLSDGFVYDCLDWKARQVDGADYRRWAIERFSGTLCVDEVHLGKKTLLLATDPPHDFPVAFALVGKNDDGHMRRFLNNLKSWGFLPLVVVTDGSGLYPALLAEVWPAARHQLCVFHVLREVNAQVLDAVKRLRRQQARRGNAGRKRKPGRRHKGVKRRRGPTAKDKAHFVFKRRHLIVKRRENLSDRERKDLVTMQGYIPQLRVLRRFVDRLLRLFEPQQSEHQARCRRAALLREAASSAVPELRKAMEMLSAEKFAKMVAFVHSPAGARVRTNNHVERVNRRLRYLEKVRYKWRRRRTVVRFLVLALDRWRQQRAGQASPSSANRSAAQPGGPPGPSSGHRSAA
jgi:Transposase